MGICFFAHFPLNAGGALEAISKSIGKSGSEQKTCPGAPQTVFLCYLLFEGRRWLGGVEQKTNKSTQVLPKHFSFLITSF